MKTAESEKKLDKAIKNAEDFLKKEEKI